MTDDMRCRFCNESLALSPGGRKWVCKNISCPNPPIWKVKLYWTYWRSVRHTDSRRASGVGYNTSRWHAFADKDFKKVNYRALCGKEVQIASDKWVEIPPLERVCSRCFEMVK